METELAHRFSNLMLSETFADVSVIVEERVFRCHKVILAAGSEFFERLLLSTCAETLSGQIHVEEVESINFEIFRQFIYTGGNSSVLNDCQLVTLVQLMELGDRLLSPSFVKLCCSEIMKKTQCHLSDLIFVFERAHLLHNTDLIAFSGKIIQKNFAEDMNCKRALQLDANVFKAYLGLSDGFMSELERFKMVEMWITSQKSFVPGSVFSVSKSTENFDMSSLLQMVNYTNMNINEFDVGPGDSDIVNWRDKYKLLYQIAVNIV